MPTDFDVTIADPEPFSVTYQSGGPQGPAGADGAPGVQGAYIVTLFRRLAGNTAPDTPTDVTWVPAGTLSGNNAGNWSTTVPIGTDNLWEVNARFNPASGATDISTWSPVFRAGSQGPVGGRGPTGLTGPMGSQGDQGIYDVSLYLRSSSDTAPVTPTDVTRLVNGTLSGTGNAAGWSLTVPSGGDPLYEVNAGFDPANPADISTWSAVTRITGPVGPQGPTGADGNVVLPAEEQRKLNDITEGTGVRYEAVTGGRITTGTIDTPGTFGSVVGPAAAEIGGRIWVEIRDGTDTSRLHIRHYRSDGTLRENVDFDGNTTAVPGASSGSQRYRSDSFMRVRVGDTVRLQYRVTTYDSYTLSNKYQIPSSGVTRTPTADVAGNTLEAALQNLHDDIGTGATNPVPGPAGPQGAYTVRAYQRSSTALTAAPDSLTWTAQDGATAATLTGSDASSWSLTVPSGNDPLYEITALFNPAGGGTTVTVWSIPFQAGAQGPAGVQGPAGAQGSQGSYTVRLYRRTTSTLSSAPTVTWTASSGLLTNNADGWATSVPRGTDPVWETNAVFNPGASPTTIANWGVPFRLTGLQGEAGTGGGGSGGIASASSERKLADITEVNNFTYVDLSGATLAVGSSETDGSTFNNINFAAVPRTAPVTSQDSVLFVQLPAGTALPQDIRFRKTTSSGVVITDIPLSSAIPIADTRTATDRYRIPGTFNLSIGDVLTVATRSGDTVSFTLSNKYRVPSSGVTGNLASSRITRTPTLDVGGNTLEAALQNLHDDIGTSGFTNRGGASTAEEVSNIPAANLAATTVQDALNELQEDVNTKQPALTGSAQRALAGITEGDPGAFAVVPNAGIGLVPPTFTTNRLDTTLTNAEVFFELPTGTPLTGLFLTSTNNSDPSDQTVYDLSNSVPLPEANTNRDRYRVLQRITSPGSNGLRIQSRTFDTYTLSSKYRIPATGVTGLPAPVPGPAGQDGADGAQGSYTVRVFTRSTNQPLTTGVVWAAPTSGVAGRLTNVGTAATWSLTVPTDTTQGALWEAIATFDPAAAAQSITVWSTSFQAGAMGPAGPPGAPGADAALDASQARKLTDITEDLAEDTFTLSDKYRIPSTGVTRTATAPAGDTVEAALSGLNQQATTAFSLIQGLQGRITNPRTTAANVSVARAGSTGIPSGSSTVQLALQELHREIDGLDVPADAEELDIDTIEHLNATNVQDALEEIHTEVEDVAARPELDASQGRKLSNVAEVTQLAYAPAPGGTVAPVVSNAPGAFVDSISGNTLTGSPIYFEVNANIVLTDLRIVVFVTADPTQVAQVMPASASTRQTSASAGKDRYITTATFSMLPTLSVALRRESTESRTLTLSDRYRVPAAGITGDLPATQVSHTPITGLSTTNVQTSLAAIRDLDNLSDSSTRKLTEITEAPITLYADVTGAMLSPAIASPTFRYPLSNVTNTGRLLFEVPTATSISNLVIRVTSFAGAVTQQFSVSGATSEITPTQGRSRYRTTVDVPLTATDTVRLETSTPSFSYTPSSKFIIPGASIRGIEFENLGTGLNGVLTSLGVEAFGRDRVIFEDQVTVNRTVNSGAFGSLLYSPTSRLSANINDYTSVSASAVPVNRGGITTVLVDGDIEVTGAIGLSDGANQSYMIFPAGRPILTRPDLHAYFIATQLSNAQTLAVGGGPATNVNVTFSDAVKVGTGNLSSDLVTRLQSIPVVTASEKRKLSNITEATTSEQLDPPGASLRLGTSLNSFAYPFVVPAGGLQVGTSNPSPAGARAVSFRVTTGTPIANISMRVYTAEGVSTSRTASLAAGAASSVSPDGVDTYFLTLTADQDLALMPGEMARMEIPTTVAGTLTLSDKYRVPASSIIDGAVLTESDGRKLAEITEDRRPDTYANEAGAGLSVARTVSGNLTPTQTFPTAFPATFTGGTGSSGERFYFEVNDGASLTGLYLRAFYSDGSAVHPPIDLSTAVQQSTTANTQPNAGKDLYLAAQTISNPTGGTLRVQRLVAGTREYTLSDNYRLRPPKARSFFDNVQVDGAVTELADAPDFYYIAESALPARDLSVGWTRVTNGQFPQPSLASPTRYVVLLKDSYPNEITWDADSTQPSNGLSGLSTTTTPHEGFNEVSGELVPDNYQGFAFLMPAWNTASSTRTGARLQAGTLDAGDVTRVDFDSTVKVTDDNVDFSRPGTTLTPLQQSKLQNLNVKTFGQTRATTSVPNPDYDVVLASAWADPEVEYDANQSGVLGQRPGYTGVREGANGQASFFNIITDSGITMGAAMPASSGLNNIESHGTGLLQDPDAGPGIRGGVIAATDAGPTNSLRFDDAFGFMAITSMRVGTQLANGTHEIMSVGDPNTVGAHSLRLIKNSSTDLRLNVETHRPGSDSHRIVQRFQEDLASSSGQVAQQYENITLDGPKDIDNTWIIRPTIGGTGFSPPFHMQVFLRVWDDNVDQGEVDITSALPTSLSNLTSALTAIENTPFTVNLRSAGFATTPATLSMGASYTPAAIGGSPSFTVRANVPNGDIVYEVRVATTANRLQTVSVGTTYNRDVVTNVPYGLSEVGFYLSSLAEAFGSHRPTRYIVAVNGVVSPPFDSTAFAPSGSQVIRFGSTGLTNQIALNRFTAVRPKRVFGRNDAVMADLTSRTQRNRRDTGGLVRHAGGQATEVFSTAYKTVTLTSSAMQNLPHARPAGSAASRRLRSDDATAVPIQWSTDQGVPDLTINAADTAILEATTNFTGAISFNLEVDVDYNAVDTQAGGSPAQRAYLLINSEVQQRLAGATGWTTVPGPKFTEEIRRSLLFAPEQRPEVTQGTPDDATTNVGNPRFRRSFSRYVDFKAGVSYRIVTTGYRNTANNSNATPEWPTADNLIRIVEEETCLQIGIAPTI